MDNFIFNKHLQIKELTDMGHQRSTHNSISPIGSDHGSIQHQALAKELSGRIITPVIIRLDMNK